MDYTILRVPRASVGAVKRKKPVPLPGAALRPQGLIESASDDWAPPFAFRDGVKIRTEQKISDFYTVYEEIGE